VLPWEPDINSLASKTAARLPDYMAKGVRPGKRKSTKPFLVLLKSPPNPSTCDAVIFTLGSRAILAGPCESSKNRQPASSSKRLNLIRTVASFAAICTTKLDCHLHSSKVSLPRQVLFFYNLRAYPLTRNPISLTASAQKYGFCPSGGVW
jgi:hypothetical protein